MNSLQLSVAARTIWGEARGEASAGMGAVAYVLFNRVRDGRWGATLFDVCLAPWQFSCWNKGDPNRAQMLALADNDPILQHCVACVDAAHDAPAMDPTLGATHYKVIGVSANWATGKMPCAVIGHHEFYRGIA